jgi:hypothetical protein
MSSYGGPSYPELMLQRLRGSAEALVAVREWVQQAQVEDLYLDFTRKDAPGTGALAANDKRGYAKALSGFANSDGGLLVWGVVAEKDTADPESADAAKDLEPIQPLAVFLSELNSILYYSTKPPVSGVENIAVPESTTTDSGYVVTYIPAGTNPPYRAENDNNNNYYKRAGSSFYPMEPYDIRDVVFRFRYPKLDLHLAYSRVKTENGVHEYALEASVTNHGPTALRDYKVVIAMPLGIETKHYPRTGLWRHEECLSADGATRYNELSAVVPPGFTVYPGEHMTVVGRGRPLRLAYWVTDANCGKRGIVSCTVYGTEMPPVVAEKPFADMQEF